MTGRRRKVVAIADARLDPVPDVVEILERLLAQARAGEIRAVGVASVHAGRCDATTYTTGDADVAHLHLAAHTLLRRILDENER